ncbi:MAG: hypothetical protein KAH32_04895, partial [Chlamydiia bacterium]|nr:hypothetical protein [Chlamydiia bacterium]
GISLNFTWNLREEKIMNPINLSVKAKDALQDAKVTEIKANAYIHNSIGNQDLINSDTYGMAVDISNAGDPSVSDFIGILGEGRGGKVKSLSKNISGSILIHLIYINM